MAIALLDGAILTSSSIIQIVNSLIIKYVTFNTLLDVLQEASGPVIGHYNVTLQRHPQRASLRHLRQSRKSPSEDFVGVTLLGSFCSINYFL